MSEDMQIVDDFEGPAPTAQDTPQVTGRASMDELGPEAFMAPIEDVDVVDEVEEAESEVNQETPEEDADPGDNPPEGESDSSDDAPGDNPPEDTVAPPEPPKGEDAPRQEVRQQDNGVIRIGDLELPKDPFQIQLDLNPDEYDEETLNTLQGIQDASNKAFQTYHKAIQTMAGEYNRIAAERQQVERQAMFDQATGALSKHVEVYGDQLKDKEGNWKSDAFVKVIRTAGALRSADDSLTPDQAIERALAATYPDARNKKERAALSKSLKQRQKQHINRPNKRDQKALSGRAKAIQSVAQKIGDDSPVGDGILEGLLD